MNIVNQDILIVNQDILGIVMTDMFTQSIDVQILRLSGVHFQMSRRKQLLETLTKMRGSKDGMSNRIMNNKIFHHDKLCTSCKFCKEVHASGNFIFYGCYNNPYRGKWCKETKPEDCPLSEEEKLDILHYEENNLTYHDQYIF